MWVDQTRGVVVAGILIGRIEQTGTSLPAAADIVEPCFPGKLAAAPAPGRVRSAGCDLIEGAGGRATVLLSAEHAADAVEQKAAANCAGRGRSGGAEEGASTPRLRCHAARPHSALAHSSRRHASRPHPAQRRAAAPLRTRTGTVLRRNAHGLITRAHRGNRAARLLAAEQRVAHA